jgi:translation initiation factor 3 subunit B
VSSNDPNLGNNGPGVNIKTDVSFYQLHRQKGDFRVLRTAPRNLQIECSHANVSVGTLSGRTTNTIMWSPRGRFVVLATVGSTSKSELQFWDLDFNSEDVGRKEMVKDKDEWGSGLQHLGTGDHYGVTDLDWDPSGRYLATSATAWKHTVAAFHGTLS